MAKNDTSLDLNILIAEIARILANVEQAMAKGSPLPNDEFTKYMMDLGKKIAADSKNMSSSDLNKYFTKVETYFKTAELHSQELKVVLEHLKDAIVGMSPNKGRKTKANPNTGIDLEAVVRNLKGLSSLYANQAAKAGGKGSVFNFNSAAAQSNSMAKAFQNTMISQSAMTNASLNKLQNFFSQWKQDEKKERKHFGEDLAEALGKNRTFVGIIEDIVKVITLLGANLLRNFGTLGTVLSTALLVASPTLAAALTKGVLAGISKLPGLIGKSLVGLLKGTGSMFKTAFSVFAKQGSAPGLAVKGLQNGFSAGTTLNTIGKSAQAGKIATLGTKGSLAGIVGGLLFDALGKDSEKRGNKGEAAMFGAASKGLGAAGVIGMAGWAAGGLGALAGGGVIGGILTAIAGLAAVIATPLTAIALAVGGIAIIVKFHKQIGEFFQKILQFLGIIAKPTEGDSGNPNLNPESGAEVKGARGKVSSFFRADLLPSNEQPVKGLAIAQDGSVRNMNSLDKGTASKLMQEYFEKDPTRANRVYELGDSKYVSLASFTNDLTVKDSTGKKRAVLAAGTNQMMDSLYASMLQDGIDPNGLLFSSGWATKGSGHSKKGQKGHSNYYALVQDMVNHNWSTQDYWANKKYLEKALGSNYDVMIEYKDAKGKTQFIKSEEDLKKAGAKPKNLHYHYQLKDQVLPGGAKQNLDEYNQAHSKASSVKVNEPEKSIDQKLKEGQTSHTIEDKPTYSSSIQNKPAYSSSAPEVPAATPYIQDPTGSKGAESRVLKGIETVVNY